MPSLRSSLSLLAPALLLAASACGAAIHPIAYQPKTMPPARAARTARALITANTVQGCLSEVDLHDNMLIVRYACSHAIGNGLVRLDRIASIELAESGGWYRVLVKHRDRTEDFFWTSKNVDDIRTLADAVASLVPEGTAPPTPPNLMGTSL